MVDFGASQLPGVRRNVEREKAIGSERVIMAKAPRHRVLILSGLLALLGAGGGEATTPEDLKAIEDAVLAVNSEMTQAAEALDADRLFSFMLDTDKGSVVQNGVVLVTRQEALERVRANLRGISKIQYRWKQRLVSVLSPDVAMLTAEGESVVNTTAGDSFSAPFAQTVVFVRRAGGWRAIHAHQSAPLAK